QRYALAASRSRHGRDRSLARSREHRDNAHLRRGRSCDQRTGAGTNCASELLGAPIQGRRYTVGLSRLALIFRVPLNETQAQSRFATHTRNIPELGISTDIPLTEYRSDVVSTRMIAKAIENSESAHCLRL